MSARRRDDDDREATTVFIVAASDVVRAGLESLIANDARFTVAGSAADVSELAASVIEGAPPNVVVFDAEGHGEETLGALRTFVEEMSERNDAPAFVVIGAEENDWTGEALRAGIVRATLPRTASSGEIIAATEAVSVGLVALDAETFAAFLTPQTFAIDGLPSAQLNDERLSSVEPKLDALTPREREVLDLLAEGLSNKEIAWRMKISEHTVKFHVASVFAKLDVSTRTEAVMQGIRQGLIMM